jgi:hypothetical protein
LGFYRYGRVSRYVSGSKVIWISMRMIERREERMRMRKRYETNREGKGNCKHVE